VDFLRSPVDVQFKDPSYAPLPIPHLFKPSILIFCCGQEFKGGKDGIYTPLLVGSPGLRCGVVHVVCRELKGLQILV